MKNFKKYLIAVSVLLAFVSCDKDIIDLTERDRLPTEVALSNLDGTRATLLQAYVYARQVHENMELSMYKQCGTDLVVAGTNMGDVASSGMPAFQYYNANLDPTGDQLNNLFNNYNEGIFRTNTVITYIDDFIPENAQEEAQKKQIKGEALALRAIMNLELVQRWDNIVLALEIPEEISFDYEFSDPEDTYAQIIADCTEAISLLPVRSELQAPNVGVASKGTAYHVLSKALMDIGDYESAAIAAEEVIADASYTLEPLDVIFSITGGKEGNENNREIILSWVFDEGDVDRAQRTSQMYVPLYDRVNGILRTMEQGGRAWSRLSPSPYYWSLFDEDDLRVDAWHKTTWYFDDPDALPDGVNLGDPVTVDLVGNADPRYIEPTTTKHWEDGTYGRTIGEAEGFRNIIVYRLAEAYLIAAEAHWRNSNTTRALTLINTIRDRAFGDTAHRFTTLNQETFIEEHARELGHEGHRWAFLKRLGLLVERVKLHNPDAAPNIEGKHVRYPIPQVFIDLTRLDQNPEY